eukprot:Tbor_TRINITY_DN105_c0_g1::TRINITY_DN105_c0_g1_i1::g.11978::m.11978/K07442/TRM61, GCD14; tRNA (adenine57-N1/adenine58-N1)-methyltransferase catalytic subunit
MLSKRGCIIEDGDTVLCYHGHDDIRPLTVERGAVLNCKKGRFYHSNIIGKRYGTRVEGEPNEKATTIKPKMLILQNCATLWSSAVSHRTQIIYPTDISVIIMGLRLIPGSIVAEAGTGSGSLTHSLARAVAPHGVVYTFDFHKKRAIEARAEFKSNKVDSVVVSGCRDVCTTNTANDTEEMEVCTNGDETKRIMHKHSLSDSDNMEPLTGFGLPKSSLDAVFLDVPAPWAAVENILHVLKPNGMLCTFSPCIEQTQRLCEKLRTDASGFVDIRTVEALTKEYEPVPCKKAAIERLISAGEADVKSGETLLFRPQPVSKGHSAYLTFARRRLPKAVEGDMGQAN